MKMSEYAPICLLGEIDKNHIFIKREDLIPYSFGGNKARKGLTIFQEIDHGHFDCVVTYGGKSSNHCRVIATLAAARKMKCYIITPQGSDKETNNSRLVHLMGAEYVACSIENVHQVIENTLTALRNEGQRPFFIPGGGHGNLGTQAYVDCYNEICDYEKLNNIKFGYIFHATGTGSTQAGLVCGQLLRRDIRSIVGISIARPLPQGRDIVCECVRQYLTFRRVSFDETVLNSMVHFVDEYTKGGYGQYDTEIDHVIMKYYRLYGLPLDRTYTGKAYAGMLQFIQKNTIRNQNILFLHTGGTPLFFDNIADRGIANAAF